MPGRPACCFGVAVLAGAAAYPAAVADAFRRELVALAAVACAALVVGILARVRWLVPASLLAAAAAYAGFLLLRDAGFDPLAPLYGAALLLVAELAEWAADPPLRETPRLQLARASSLVLLATAGAVAGGAVLVAARVAAARDDPLLEPLGVAAAVATVALVAWLGRQRERS